MGRTSSKRTSSKRKTSKLHSEARKKKKNKRTKSKKSYSRKDYSSSSSDDSRSLVSISSSSLEDEHYRSRSRRKSKLKGSKKRAADRSSTKRDKVTKIKKPQKKKLKRESSFTSLSSDSHSYSTDSVAYDTKKKLRKKSKKRERRIDSITRDSHSGSDESREVESRWGRVRETSKEERDFSRNKRLKVRSRSCSPDNRNTDESDSSFPIVQTQNNSRRLRSVIIVVKQSEDDLKEEMVHDHSGYPSTRSNESTDLDNKRGLDHSPHDNPETRDLETSKRDEASLSDLKSSEVSPVLPDTENNLESMLRLQALENMIKFKGAQIEKLKAPTKLSSSKVEEQSRVPISTKEEPVIIQKKTQKANSVILEKSVKAKSAITSESVQNASKGQDRIYTDDPMPKALALRRLGGSDVCNLVSRETISKGQYSNILKSSVSEPSIIPNKAHNANALVSESVGQASKNSGQIIILKSSISEPIKNITDEEQSGNSSVAERSVNNKEDLTAESSGEASEKDEHDNNVPRSSISEPSSSTKPALEGNSSKDHQSTDKDGSQFQQKTMSVMRGGEMVEVSYKVYIPKKAPALARRPLRR